MLEKLKSWLADDTLYIAVLLVLVGVVSFLLGQQSVTTQISGSEGVGAVVVSEPPPSALVSPHATSSLHLEAETTVVVASKSGERYHLPDCPGAKQISDKNLISFSTIEAAEAAGYSPAANCPGLR